jgi:hypothetical protein
MIRLSNIVSFGLLGYDLYLGGRLMSLLLSFQLYSRDLEFLFQLLRLRISYRLIFPREIRCF